MNEKEISDLEKVFKIFANKHRLSILSFLKRKKEASVGEISDNLKTSFKATSKHLAILSNAGILKSRYDGPFVMHKMSENLPEQTDKFINLLN